MRCVLVLLCWTAVVQATPQIDLIVYGPGDDVWSRFGHCAIRIGGEAGRAYSYGYADFAADGFLWRYLRRDARFALHSRTWVDELEVYSQRDRTIVVMPIALTDREATWIADRLRQPLTYRYEHQTDNCATRVRDLIDEACGSAFSRSARARERIPLGDSDGRGYATYRDFTRDAMSGSPFVSMVCDFIGGPNQDRVLTRWEWMYLPENLRELTEVAQAQLVYQRTGPALRGEVSPWRWLLPFVLVAVAVALGSRWARWMAATVAGLLGGIVWTLVAVSNIDDYAWNENAILFWPTDLLLLSGKGRRYLQLRLAVLVGYAFLKAATTWFPQRNLTFLAGATALIATLLWSMTRRERRPTVAAVEG